MSDAQQGDSLQLLAFELAGQRYALELTSVREVVRAVLITPLPGAPPVIEGAVDVRGEVIPVYDFRLRFDLPARRLHPDDVMVIAWTGQRRVGIRCERAWWLEPVQRRAVADAPPLERGGPASPIAGVVRLEDGLVLIHDLPAFLQASEAEALVAAMAARAAGDAD